MKFKIFRFCLLFNFLAGGSLMVQAQQLDPELQDLIYKGNLKSRTVSSKNLEAEQAKIDQRLAKAVFLPKITLNGSFTRLNDDITFDDDTQNLLFATQKLLVKEAIGLPFNAPFPTNIPLKDAPNLQNKNILKSSVDMDWVLFSGLEAHHALKASKHKESSLHFLEMAEKDKVALQIIEVYDQLALVQASQKVLVATQDYLEEQHFYVSKAIENGLATPISRKKIALAQQQLIAKQLDFEHNQRLLVEVLHQLTGEPKSALLLLQPKLQPMVSEVSNESEKRNEVKALEEAEQATRYKVKMEKSNFIPKIAVKAHYEFIEDDLSLLDPKWFVGAGIRWTIFDGNNANLKSKKTQLEAQMYQDKIDDANDKIALSIIKAEQTYQAALQNSEVVKKEIELANDTYEMVNKQYKNNLASITEVLDALNDVEKANFKLQQSYFNQRRAEADLLYARGILNY